MRKCISAFIASAMLFSLCIPTTAVADGTNNGYELIFTIDSGSVTITGVSGSGSTLEIPDTIAGLNVTSIADNFFTGSNELRTVILPDTLRSIGTRAFSACQKLNSVYIGSDTSYIGDYAFTACPSLSSISVSTANTVYRSENSSLYKGDALVLYAGSDDAVVSSSTRVIGKRAFFGRTALTSVDIPDSVEVIGDYAFSGCLALNDITIPDSVTSIGNYCFFSCSGLESAKLSNSLKAIPESCFSGCSALRDINIPVSVSYIGANAFYSCESLKSIYIPPTVETIGTNALGRTYSLRSGSEDNISDFRILGSPGSTAEKYASALSMVFSEDETILTGDVNEDSIIDGRDATVTLTEYARISVGYSPTFSARQTKAADFNKDSVIDARDASAILVYYAETSVVK